MPDLPISTLQTVKFRRNDEVATYPGRFLYFFPFHSHADGLRERATPEAGFSGRHETRADASRPGSDAYISLFFLLFVKYICYPETSLCPQLKINSFYLES